MDAPEPLKSPYSEPESTQIGDQNTFVITYNHIGDLAPPRNQQGNLFLCFKGEVRYLTGQFTGDYLMTRYSSAVKILEKF
jgi:hypothetical protein